MVLPGKRAVNSFYENYQNYIKNMKALGEAEPSLPAPIGKVGGW
jgi:hypothetical protein